MSELRTKMQDFMELKGYSSQTVRNYIQAVAKYCEYYRKHPNELSSEHITNYLLFLKRERNMSSVSVNQAYSGLKIFYTQVLKREWDNTIPRSRRINRLPHVLSREEVSAILEAKTNIKHRVLLKLLYSTGMRVSELCNLKLEDIDSKRMLVRINQGKGKKDRLTILSKHILTELREYYLFYRPRKWLFEGYYCKQYSTRSLQNVFKHAKKKAGITSKCSCHTLRHSFATHLLEQGVDIFKIKELLGHNSIRSTTIYLHLSSKHIQKIQDPLMFLQDK